MTKFFRLGTFSLIALSALNSTFAFSASSSVQFDPKILKARGLDLSLMKYFSDKKKFMPGIRTVDVEVNGNDKGGVVAKFDDNGELCLDDTFLQSAGIIAPSHLEQSDSCYNYRNIYPQSVISLLPEQEKVILVVPDIALDKSHAGGVSNNYKHGGTAGVFNYSLLSTKNNSSDSSSTYNQLMLEEGANYQDWVFRSRQSITQDNNEKQEDNLYSYAQHTFIKSKKIFQVGQINTGGTVFSGKSISGLQIMPDDALQDDNNTNVTLNGIAKSAQARVDVRQAGNIVYSTLVPAGPFTLTDVPIIHVNSDIDVTIHETDGSQSHFTVSADEINQGELNTPSGLSAAIGRFKNSDSSSEPTPMLATVSDGWKIKKWVNTGVGAMVAQSYQQLAITVDVQPHQNILLSSALNVSHDARGGNRGQSENISASFQPSDEFGFDISTTHYSSGFRELEDSFDDEFMQYSNQYTFGTHWSYPTVGTFSLRYSLSQGGGDENGNRYISASWGKTVGKFSVNFSWQRNLSNDNKENDSIHEDNGDQIYVNISMPIGEQRVSSYSHMSNNNYTVGIGTNGQISDDTNYSISTDRNMNENESNFNSSMTSNLHYTQLGLSLGTEGESRRNYGATLNGGVVLHKDGTTFSPKAVKDTFAIVDAGKNAQGIELNTSSGKVWTDHWGFAIIPSMPAYHTARIEMNTDHLPNNVDVTNGFSQLAVGRGSVGAIQFHVSKVHRAMIIVHMRDGSLLNKGATIVDGNGQYAATMVDNGVLFLEDFSQHIPLYVINDEGERICQIKYHHSDNVDNNYYDNVQGTCS